MSRFNYQNRHKKAFVALALQCEKIFGDYAASLSDAEAKAARKVGQKIDKMDLCTLYAFKGIIEEAFRNDACGRPTRKTRDDADGGE